MMKLKFLGISAISLLAVAPPVMAQKVETRAEFAGSLFSGREQYENFNRIDELFPVEQVKASSHPKAWPIGCPIDIPEEFAIDGRTLNTAQFLSETDTSALLVLKDGKIRFEKYWLTGGTNVHWISMSVGKSFTSALVGAALGDGLIESVDDPVTRYLPDLKGSAYDGVRIKDVLQMSSGVYWREDYSDTSTDIFRLSEILAMGGVFSEFPPTLKKREHKPATFNRYNSADTIVLAMLVEKVTGMSLAKYTRAKLWEPLGAESNAYWIVDDHGSGMSFGGFNSTARDYARLGELYRLGGKWDGQQLLPETWVHDSVTADAPHLTPGKRDNSDSEMGYGYQWWLPGAGNNSDFSAIGVYNQFIYVNPKSGVVIVKLSANSHYGQTNDESSWLEAETFALFRKLATEIDAEPAS